MLLYHFEYTNNFLIFNLAPTTGSSVTLTIEKSGFNKLCVLVRVTAATDTADLNNISVNSGIEDYNIVPIARSYDNGVWKRAAGPYAQKLVISSCSSACDLNIPILSNLDAGRFIMMPFEHSISDEAKVSRFFQQTSFGPTMAMINSWNYGRNLFNEMASWVKNQMNKNTTPLTSHREYFRKRVEGALEREEEMSQYGDEKQMFKVRSPCKAGSRWTQYAFAIDDYGEELTVTKRNDGSWLVEVMGVPRTVMSTWKDSEGSNIGAGTFIFGEFCSFSMPSS